jgi:superfamily II DNA or RNA helicase
MTVNRNIREVLDEQRVSKAFLELHPDAPEIKLHLWQENAIDMWRYAHPDEPAIRKQNYEDKEWFGIIQAITGAGKTVFAIESIWVWLQEHPTGTVTVLVPTRALQHQWRNHLRKAFNEPIGVLGGGKRDWQNINVVTMDTAAKGLPECAPDHLIVVDECHNIGSAGRKYAILNNPHTAVLGLSATPAREDTGLGMVSYLCGPVVYEYGYIEGRQDGVIMPFTIRAVSVPLMGEEAVQYQDLCDEIRTLSFILKQRYGSHTNIFAIKPGDNDEEDGTLTSFKHLCMERKRVLNQAYHRFSCVDEILRRHPDMRAMLFHERINQLEWMHSKYSGNDPQWMPDLENIGTKDEPEWVGTPYEHFGMRAPDASEWLDDPPLNPEMYHGEMKRKEADAALERFKNGESRLLMSVKALREGVDVPDADLGIMVSGTNATRARVQTLGRCLRKGEAEEAIIYILYVANTTDAKGLANLKYNGRLPDGTIEWWRYDGTNLTFINREDPGDIGKPDPAKPKTRDHICEKCHKTFFKEDSAKPENHHCSVARTRDGRKGVDIWGALKLKLK